MNDKFVARVRARYKFVAPTAGDRWPGSLLGRRAAASERVSYAIVGLGQRLYKTGGSPATGMPSERRLKPLRIGSLTRLLAAGRAARWRAAVCGNLSQQPLSAPGIAALGTMGILPGPTSHGIAHGVRGRLMVFI